MEDPVVPLERNLYGHPLAGLLWEWQFEKGLLKYGWEKVPNRECLFVNREKGLFLSVYVDDIKLAGKKQKRILMKDVDLGEPTSFLDHVYLGCTQRECRISKDIIKDFRQGYTKNCQQQKPRWNLMPKRYLHGPMTWKVVQRNAWKDIANLRIKRTSNETKSQRHSWMIIHLKKKKMDQLKNYLLFVCKLFWNVILGTHWKAWYFMVCDQTGSCGNAMDKSMLQTISTFDRIHSSHMWIQAMLICGKHSTTLQIRIVSMLLFLSGDLVEINIRRSSMHFRMSNVRANKLDVQETDLCSHSSAKAEVISLDAGLRMDGIPALDLWDSVIEVFHSSPNRGETCRQLFNQTCENKFQPRTPISIWPILITFHQAEHILVPMLCCMCLKTTKQWSRWL